MSTAVDEIKINNWDDSPDEDNIYHDLPTPTHTLKEDADNDEGTDNNASVNAEAAELEETVTVSTTTNGYRRST